MALVTTGVFERSGQNTLSERAFFLILGGVLLFGFALTGWIAHYAVMNGIYISGFPMLIIGLGIPIVGIIIATKSDNPLVSFIGYNMVVVPFGFVLAPILTVYSQAVVSKSLTITFGTTAFMSILAFSFPGLFAGMGRALFIALISLVVMRFLQIFIPALDLGIIDWFAAGIFTLYIGYDLYRAQIVPKTLDNAIDIALQLYLDIINLFLTLLRIFGRRD